MGTNKIRHPKMISLECLSAFNQEQFSAALDGVFEHSPWVASRTWHARPFTTRAALHSALMNTLKSAPHAEQLALMRAHPELAGKAAVRGELTAESRREQAGARLDACSVEEFEQLQTLNAAYTKKFNLPFILAVRGLNREQIIERFSARLTNTEAVEFAESMHQIELITGFRLADLVSE